jgi:hypothetical protein
MLIVVDGLLMIRLEQPAPERVLLSIILIMFNGSCEFDAACGVCDSRYGAYKTRSSDICTCRSILEGSDSGLQFPTMHHQREALVLSCMHPAQIPHGR